MKISIAIPQYNRINFLLKSLSIIENQTYSNIEIVISDDCSTDDTEQQIKVLIPTYKFPIIYQRNEKNLGYDRNYRKCIELSTGDYVVVIGNDDSILGADSISYLADFLKHENYPEIGFCNCVEERTNYTLIKRAFSTGIIGSGSQIALKNYSCFSFVGGLIYQKAAFHRYNTDKYDGSIYSQMYLGCLMVSSGCRLFSIEQPLVIKDLLVDNVFRNSYRDRIAKKWKDFRVVDGGLPSVLRVLVAAFKDSDKLNQEIAYKLHRRIYSVTFPFWIQDYKYNNALPEAAGLFIGLRPSKLATYNNLTPINKLKINIIYFAAGFISILFPSWLFMRIKEQLYQLLKK